MSKLPIPEIWKDIVGFEGYFQVSNMGKIRSVDKLIIRRNGSPYPKKGSIKKQFTLNNGYQHVTFRFKGRPIEARLVHRVVMETFHGKSDLHVNHKNGNRSDNRLSNLEFVTPLENNRHRCTVLQNKKRFGVAKMRYGKWRTSIRVGKTKKEIGSFINKEEAYEAFHSAYLELHGVEPWKK